MFKNKETRKVNFKTFVNQRCKNIIKQKSKKQDQLGCYKAPRSDILWLNNGGSRLIVSQQ